jgi:hypothetical protein
VRPCVGGDLELFLPGAPDRAVRVDVRPDDSFWPWIGPGDGFAVVEEHHPRRGVEGQFPALADALKLLHAGLRQVPAIELARRVRLVAALEGREPELGEIVSAFPRSAVSLAPCTWQEATIMAATPGASHQILS